MYSRKKDRQSTYAKNRRGNWAFGNRLLLKENGNYSLRWFTPTFEIDLCGHATLATAFVVLNYLEPHLKKVEFNTISGNLSVFKRGSRYEMLLSKREPENIVLSESETKFLKTSPLEVYSSRDLLCVLKDEKAVKSYVPDYKALAKLSRWLGIVITAKGEKNDFVSRYFAPNLKAKTR